MLADCPWGLSVPLHIVSEETRERYIRVIDSILAKSDLATISERRIRRGLQDAVGYDLTPEKVYYTWWPCVCVEREIGGDGERIGCEGVCESVSANIGNRPRSKS